MRLTLRASAKINLDLRVGARRPDGYHDLQTMLADARPARHGDDRVAARAVRARRRPGADAARPDATWCGAPPRRCGGRPASRAIRAASASASPSAFRRRRVWAVAAATPPPRWSGLSRVWRLPAHARRLDAGRRDARVGRAVLSRRRHRAWVWAAASSVYPLANRPRRHVVVVLPDFGVSTPTPTAGWRRTGRSDPADPAPRTLHPGPWTPGGWRNDLEGPVERRHPVIGAIRRRLATAGAELARMSGSGSAVFGLFSSRARGPSRGCRPGAARATGWCGPRTRPRNLVESRRLA